MADLTHFDAGGAAHMVDVSDKAETARQAKEEAEKAKQEALQKGDVKAVKKAEEAVKQDIDRLF